MLRLYVRLLQEQLSNTTTNDNGDDGSLDLYDAKASWVPIYVSVVLTTIQVLVFLVIFQCSRRSPSVQQVFDRRRSIRPGRTPPPLMQKRGCCRGWLALEWWRLHISDESYNRQARREHPLRSLQQKKHQQKQQAAVANGDDESDDDEERKFVRLAEQKCYRESPFWDPTAGKTMTTESLLAAQQDAPFFSTTGSIPEATEIEGSKLECQEEDQSNGDNDNVEMRKFDSVECDQHEIEHMRESVHPETNGTLPTCSSSNGLLNIPPDRMSRRRLLHPKSIKRARTSASDPTGLDISHSDQVPLTVGGSERGSSRSIRFQDNSSTPHRRWNSIGGGEDAAFGTEYSERLARLRYAKSDTTETWDTATVTTFVTFLKKRVLMLAERQQVDSGYQPEAVSLKAVRRPLTMEQQELLRCIGLDAFMTLRFLEFGFDVSFWPFLFSLITLIPTFATGEEDVVGFFSTTVIALAEGSPRHWVVVLFGWVHFLYILRRIWIEWEIFLPLRYDFLENGDFDREKHQEQYRKTVVVEYIPHSQRKDKVLYDFFDAIFPGQVERAEVLLDTENLRSMIKDRLDHIIGYEDVFAKKVHAQAQYLRQMDLVKNGILIKRCCGSILRPQAPDEPRIRVIEQSPREDTGNVFINPSWSTVRDCKTYNALPYHHEMIQKITKDIEDEYTRLVREQHKESTQSKRESSWISRCLRLDAVFLKNEELRSSTAFVEFKSSVAKEAAIQCNVTGLNHFLQVKEVPEIREIIWENFHISRSLVEARRWWANITLIGALIAWSFLVAAIRSVKDLSENLGLSKVSVLATVVDVYLPALLVEGLVRILPFAIKALCMLVRFKAASEVDYYVLKWYLGFRTITFIFVIIGGTIIDSGDDFVDDPMGFFEKLANNVAENVQFFISYVIVAGSVQLFFRLSQIHNVALHWIINKTKLEEAMSQRRLEKLQTTVKSFHLDEFIPLFVFIFMIGAAYGSLAPLSCFFVAVFFKCAYRVFFYMTLFIYGNDYEGGGLLFYTITNVLFYIIYLIILLISSYLSLHGTGTMAGVFAVLLFVVALVHIDIHGTFVIPSKSLSLTKARLSDKKSKPDSRDRANDMNTDDEDNSQMLRQLGQRRDIIDEESLRKRLFPQDSSRTSLLSRKEAGTTGEGLLSESVLLQKAIERMERRYVDDLSELSDTEASGPAHDFFIYRQPSLNRATWEVAPRQYRDSARVEKAEVWR